MCGIAGILKFHGEPVHEHLLRDMIATLAHRGPDARNIWCAGPIGFGHARLSIIDLSTGDQPMHREDLGLTVIFNGEIYNYLELRDELVQQGCAFRTQSDTEILLVGYRQWGPALFSRLRGMFAFALWDAHAQELVCARDRLGKKPFCYSYSDANGFVFASEIKALLACPWISRDIRLPVLLDYLDTMYVPDTVSIWKDVRKLPPAHWLKVSRTGQVIVAPYWSFTYPTQSLQVSPQEAAERLETLLEQAVKIRLRSDVPLGVFLSGGVDSSLIAATAAKLSAQPLKTFHVRFDRAQGESGYADTVARAIGSRHEVIDVSLDALGLLQDVGRLFDEPFGDTSALPCLAMSRVARQQVTVVLNGDGTDELFGGYDRYLNYVRFAEGNDPLRAFLAKQLRLLKTRARTLPPWISVGLAALFRPYRGQIDALRGQEADYYARAYGQAQVAQGGDVPRLFRQEFKTAPARRSYADFPAAPDPLSACFAFDQFVYLCGDILKKADMTSMAFGLEGRSPFLDEDIHDFSWQIPRTYHVQNKRPQTEAHWHKMLPKTLCAKAFGDDFTYRPKQGFASPIHDWLRQPAMADIVRDGFLAETSPLRDFLDIRELHTTWQHWQSGKNWMAQAVWNLIVLDIWARTYKPTVRKEQG